MKKSNKLASLSPLERELAAYAARKRGNAKGGKNRWKGKTAAEKSAAMRRIRAKN